MARLRIHNYAISTDGYGAGPEQSLENPMGVGGMALHQWALKTRSFHEQHGKASDGETGVDDDFMARGFDNIGAWILGRNMFGPIRGPWPNEDWKGWWGTNPPYHNDVFVLTHHARAPLVMEGGTTFHFVTDGIRAAYDRAFAAAGGKDVRLGGGAATVRAYLQARLVDEMHVAVAPVVLGGGEPLFAGLDLPALGYQCSRSQYSDRTAHYVFTKR